MPKGGQSHYRIEAATAIARETIRDLLLVSVGPPRATVGATMLLILRRINFEGLSQSPASGAF